MLPLQYESLVREAQHADLAREAENERLAQVTRSRPGLAQLWQDLNQSSCNIPLLQHRSACRMPSPA
jgi:hypothetical protein